MPDRSIYTYLFVRTNAIIVTSIPSLIAKIDNKFLSIDSSENSALWLHMPIKHHSNQSSSAGEPPRSSRPYSGPNYSIQLDQLFDLSAIRDGSGEFSIENNPESVSQELADTYAQGGVNRISMGAQSFNPKHLQSLDRIHDPEKVPVAIEYFLSAGIKRISLDLIYAIPDQTVEDWDTDLRTALAMPIEHLSAYGLTYEPGTKMTALLARGKFNKMPDEIEVQMYQHGLKTLRAHGFERYEVSNHAKPGAECRHNLSYWRSENWLVAGPSASGHFNGTRWKNTPRLDDYLKIDENGFAPICDLEPPDPRRELMDILMTSVRLSEGVDATACDRAS